MLTPPPIADGPPPPPPDSQAAWEALVAAFEDASLPWAGWRHPQHLAVSTHYLQREGLEATRQRLPGRIRAFNAAHGVEATPTRGYHETLTRCWLLLVAGVLAQGPAGEPAIAALARVVAALDDQQLPLRHYSRERLMSAEARAGWVEPDLLPLYSPSM